jgi:hypothetical protein
MSALGEGTKYMTSAYPGVLLGLGWMLMLSTWLGDPFTAMQAILPALCLSFATLRGIQAFARWQWGSA